MSAALISPPRSPFRLPRFYAIIERSQLGGMDPAEAASRLLKAGVRAIQYRDKLGSSRQVYAACQAIAERVRNHDSLFIVNDRADIARTVSADGVHLGQDDLPVELARRALAPDQYIGFSTHNEKQLSEADWTSADYVAIGPVFATHSKARPDPVVGLDGLRTARRLTRKPLVAIGGITLQNIRQVLDAGADSVALIGALWDAPDLEVRIKEFLEIVASYAAPESFVRNPESRRV